MKKLIFPVVVTLFIVGCFGLSQEQQAKVDKIAKSNDDLVQKLQAVPAAVKAGTMTAIDAIALTSTTIAQIDANRKELDQIKSESGSKAFWGAALAIFGRSALHILSQVLPAGGTPVWAGVQMVLSFLLGGSQSAKPGVAATTPPSAA